MPPVKPQHNLVMQAAKGAGWVSVATGGQYFVSLGAFAILARLVSPAEFGVVGLALAFLNFSAMFSEVGMSTALLRRSDITDAHVDVAFMTVMVLGCAAGLGIALAAGWIADFFYRPQLASMLRVIAFIVPISGASSISLALLSRRGDFRFLSLSDLPGVILGSCLLSIGLALLGFGAWAPVLGAVVQQVLGAAIRFAGARHSLAFRWDRRAFRDLLGFSVSQTIARWLAYVAANGDNFVVGRLLGMEALGLYGRAYKLMMIPVEVLTAGSQKVLFPLMSRVQADDVRLRRAYCTGLGFLVTLLTPTSVVIIFAARPIVQIMLGERWLGAVPALQALFAFLGFRAIYRHLNIPTFLRGWSFTIAIQCAIQAVLVVAGAIVGAAGGIAAVALAVGVAQAVYYVICAWSANRLLAVSWLKFIQLHGPGLATGLLLGIAFGLLSFAPWMRHSALLDLASYGGVAGVALLALYLGAPRIFLGLETLLLLSQVTGSLPVIGRQLSAWCEQQLPPEA